MIDAIQVMTAAGTREEADKLARALVERRLAACVQVLGPIASTYRWQGKIEESQEWLCLCKTRREHYEAIQTAIRELHSYDVPEILAVPVLAGSADYLSWLARETGGETAGGDTRSRDA